MTHQGASALSHGFVGAHPWVQLHELAGVDHMELIDPGSSAWPTVVEALMSRG